MKVANHWRKHPAPWANYSDRIRMVWIDDALQQGTWLVEVRKEPRGWCYRDCRTSQGGVAPTRREAKIKADELLAAKSWALR